MSKVPSVKLNDGNEAPMVGLGTFLADKGVLYRAVLDAIDAGYRHFDCADYYQNQDEVGRALREAIEQNKVTRDELFVVTKVWPTWYEQGRVLAAAKRMLQEFGFEYLDLLLMHWPTPFKSDDNNFWPVDDNDQVIVSDIDITDVYKQLEQVKQLGLVKSIGVSNFNSDQLRRVLKTATTKPVTNQVESHPYLSQQKLLELCQSEDIVLTAYTPLGRAGTKQGHPNLLEDETIKKLADKYKKPPANIAIKWQVQRGVIVIPKSVTKQRIIDNIDIFDFTLSDDDMKEINSLNKDHRVVTFDHHGSAKHKEWPFRLPF